MKLRSTIIVTAALLSSNFASAVSVDSTRQSGTAKTIESALPAPANSQMPGQAQSECPYKVRKTTGNSSTILASTAYIPQTVSTSSGARSKKVSPTSNSNEMLGSGSAKR